MDNSEFSRAEKNLLALPIPSLNVGFLARNASDQAYYERAELIGYSGPLQIVEKQTAGCLKELLHILGAID